MQSHRFASLANTWSDTEEYESGLSRSAFVVPPMVMAHGWAPVSSAWQQQLYQWAFQQGQAVARPSWPERDVLGVWN